ncbi:dsDNA nuclease domain-containing protein [Maricaulis sp.]|uniref:dsDNA nuclease domain-containing protein n=1 Tax=Maricaulis sp. TaxID=1486257 RepID=UPI002B27A58F|nr:dsDNA nuclease domain-containing protein [Maricaulis sp.]
MADLISSLTSKPQREIAGSDSASRFDYQKNWAFCQMMRRHIADESYLIAFEFHDDVLFLSPADHPNYAEFIQVKTSSASKPRSLSSITTRPKGKASIVGKMYSNLSGICSKHDVRVVLVSNNAFEFTDKELCAKDLDAKLRQRLLAKLTVEIPGFDEKHLEKLNFLVTGVSLEAMQSFLVGEATELFCHKFGEDHGLNIRTWIRLIQGEITRRNNHPSDAIATTDELIEKKCIGQNLVEGTLNHMHAKTRQTLDVATISNYLTAAGWTMTDLIRLQKKLPEASADYYNPLNGEVKDISDRMRYIVMDENGSTIDLDDFLDKCVDMTMDNDHIANIYKQTDYLRALGALVYYDEV